MLPFPTIGHELGPAGHTEVFRSDPTPMPRERASAESQAGGDPGSRDLRRRETKGWEPGGACERAIDE